MSAAETAEFAVKLSLDSKQFSAAIGRIDKRLGAFSGAVNRNLGKAVDAGIYRGARLLVGAFQGGVEALRELETVSAQTEAVLKSTSNAAGVSAQQVRTLAEKYEGLNAVIDDKVIQSAENLLLTFTKIGKDAFEPALAAVLDFATATGTDATSAAKLLGRALNDPVRGMTQLRRAGISLDAPTEKRIKDLTKQGKLYEAQKILLDELSKRYGGSFARAGETAAGKQAKLADAVEDVQKAFAEKLLPVVTKISERITKYLAKPETLAFFNRLGDSIAALASDGNLDLVASSLETAATVTGKAIALFNQLPPEVKALAVGALTLNKVTGGAIGGAAEAFGKILGSGLKQIFAAQVTVVGANVTGGGLGIGEAAGAGAGASKLGKIGGAVSTASKIIVPLAVGVAISEAIKDASGQTDEQWQQTYKASLNRLGLGLGGEIKSATARQIGHIDHGTAAVKAAEASSLSAFRAGERATQAVNAKLAIANSVLAAIRRKPTKFTANTTVSVSTKVSVSYLQQQTRYKERVAKTGTLVAS